MSRRSIALGLSLLAVWLVVDPPRAEAQLFRRLEERIRSRIGVAPLTPPSAARPNARQAVPTPADGALQPRTVAPLQAGQSSNYGGPVVDPNTQGPTANYLPGLGWEFGGSILSPSISVSEKPRPSLGIDVSESQSGIQGLTVIQIREYSQAAQAGLAPGDVIVSVDGVPTPTIAAIGERLKRLEVGQTLRATVVRGNQTSDILIPVVGSSVVLARPPVQPRGRAPIAQTDPKAAPKPAPIEPILLPIPEPIADEPSADRHADLGIEVEDARGVRGAMIVAVEPSSPAGTAGLRTGDRVVAVDGRFISGREGLMREVSTRSSEDSMTLQLVRGEELIESVVEFDRSVSEPKMAPEPAATATSDSSEKPSLLKGIGSALGGLLSGDASKSTKTKDVPAEKPADRNLAGDPSENPFIKPVPNDPLAFGDDEPIRQVGFDSPESPKPVAGERRDREPLDLKGNAAGESVEPQTELRLDPPSVEKLDLPPGAATPVGEPTEAEKQLAELIAQLRLEIRLLEERLKELEKEE